MDEIEKHAIFARAVLSLTEEDVQPSLIDVLRRAKTAKFIKDFGPGEAQELGGVAAKWVRKSKTILIDPALWDQLDDVEDPELRFTILHELGHAVLNHADRNRKFGGAPQYGSKISIDEDEADRFASAFSIPLSFAEKIDVLDRDSLMRQFGLPADKTALRMVDLQMHLRHSNLDFDAISTSIEKQAEIWLREKVFIAPPASKSVPTRDEDWDF